MSDVAPFQLFPMLDGPTEAALRASIERFGVLVPVLVDQHGRIIDGHHRDRIADELGAKCPRMVVTVNDDDDARQIAAELNLARRHMTTDARREIEYMLAAGGHSTRAIAGAVGVDQSTVVRDLAAAGDAGASPARVLGLDGKTYPRRTPLTEKEHRAETRRATLFDQRAAYDAEPTYATDVRRGDFRDVLADIEPGSVDLVLTDPPYGLDAVPLYGELAEHAARWLRPGGSLITYAGHSTLPDVLPLMARHLRYHWCAALVQDGPGATLHHLGVFVGWKPVLWFTAGAYPVRHMFRDVVRSEFAPDQEQHRWAQNVAPIVRVIEQLTEPGELIVDPFAGTAGWGAAALGMGRRWIGADLGGAVIPDA